MFSCLISHFGGTQRFSLCQDALQDELWRLAIAAEGPKQRRGRRRSPFGRRVPSASVLGSRDLTTGFGYGSKLGSRKIGWLILDY